MFFCFSGDILSDLIFWFIVSFISGSIPYSLIISSLIIKKDVRDVGDGNPGATNAWIIGGWQIGTIAMILDISKSAIPVSLAIREFSSISGFNSLAISLIALAPILGHAWSPLLKFKGGKALASSWGSWIALTGGIAFPLAMMFLAPLHAVQKNHAVTVTLSILGLLGASYYFIMVFAIPVSGLAIVLFGILNLLVVIYKHRKEYSEGILFRGWIRNVSNLFG